MLVRLGFAASGLLGQEALKRVRSASLPKKC